MLARYRGLFIAFIGVPGVGKSTIAIELAKKLKARVFIEPGEESYPIDQNKPWQNQVAVLEKWVCEINLKNFNDARRLADMGNITIADGGIFLVNQELINSPAYSWWYDLIPQEERNNIYQTSLNDWSNAPCPDVLVLFEANIETWLHFLKKRARKTDEDAEKHLSTYLDQQKVMAEAAEKFANFRKISFIKFNNEYGSTEKSAELLHNALNSNSNIKSLIKKTGIPMQSRLHIEIINNLKMLKISELCIQKIMHTVDNMPGQEHLKGALKFLTEITNSKSQRENYYQYSNYLAEYFCTISNLGLFAVAFYYNDYATLAAATFSALSHAIPSQRLHDLDMLGVFIIFGKAIANYKMLMQKPHVLAWGLSALTVNVLDTIITRSHLDKIGPSIHVTWHLAAAFALYKFNQAQMEFSETELQAFSQAISNQAVPGFLQCTHEKITEYIYNYSNTNKCIIV